MIIGDFNTVMLVNEKNGGRIPLSTALNDFNDWIYNCGLIQAPKSGLQLSWSNGRCGRKRILCNLDRAFYNLQWLNKYSGWKYNVSSRGISYHSFLVGSNIEISKPKNSPFKFQTMWTTHPEFLKLVLDSWNEILLGNPIFVFMNKLKRLKKILKLWNWEVFDDIYVKLKKAEDEVQETNIVSDEDPSNIVLLNNYITARGERDVAAQNYHNFLIQKARVNWIKFWDANTAFFHTSIKLRQTKNTIVELTDDSGVIFSDQDQIATMLIEYFKTKFSYQPVQITESILDAIQNAVSHEDNTLIEKIPSKEDIREAVFQLNQDGSPGPDGFTGIFYRIAWDIISEDLTATIQFCWLNQVIPAGLNSNFLILLPKTKEAKKVNQFRPIGLSNFCFKIITKIITIRISSFLHKLISPQQCAFVKEINIHEQILLASELVNEMSSQRRGGNVGLKLDITQAYDTLSWEFLMSVLRQYGFSEKFCNWIKILLRTTKISIILNGGPIGYFGVGRGVK
ncbi:uncharacterized protein LOC113338440 [Papaver somniferum]|uniref:uncharacterized protein LOC113338440 n=1 Tax=Papaver somniferum TaxID=3469 RepID=UPI000E704AA6|nr:uncharacterized protein LOC113338440 [Papaver somniferum]